MTTFGKYNLIMYLLFYFPREGFSFCLVTALGWILLCLLCILSILNFQCEMVAGACGLPPSTAFPHMVEVPEAWGRWVVRRGVGALQECILPWGIEDDTV